MREVVTKQVPEMAYLYENYNVYGLSPLVNPFMPIYTKIRMVFTAISFGMIFVLLLLTVIALRKQKTNFNNKTFHLNVRAFFR